MALFEPRRIPSMWGGRDGVVVWRNGQWCNCILSLSLYPILDGSCISIKLEFGIFGIEFYYLRDKAKPKLLSGQDELANQSNTFQLPKHKKVAMLDVKPWLRGRLPTTCRMESLWHGPGVMALVWWRSVVVVAPRTMAQGSTPAACICMKAMTMNVQPWWMKCCFCLCSEGGVSKKHLNAKLEHEEFHMSHTVPYHQPMAQVHTLKAANNIYTITVNSQ